MIYKLLYFVNFCLIICLIEGHCNPDPRLGLFKSNKEYAVHISRSRSLKVYCGFEVNETLVYNATPMRLKYNESSFKLLSQYEYPVELNSALKKDMLVCQFYIPFDKVTDWFMDSVTSNFLRNRECETLKRKEDILLREDLSKDTSETEDNELDINMAERILSCFIFIITIVVGSKLFLAIIVLIFWLVNKYIKYLKKKRTNEYDEEYATIDKLGTRPRLSVPDIEATPQYDYDYAYAERRELERMREIAKRDRLLRQSTQPPVRLLRGSMRISRRCVCHCVKRLQNITVGYEAMKPIQTNSKPICRHLRHI